MGNCCILNRVRNIRNYDVSKIDDAKERKKIEDAKKMVALKKNKKENYLTKEQEKSMEELNKILGI
jgi:aspartate-semialdehyde dehydrogenase